MSDPSPKPRIALGRDQAGCPMKESIRQFLENAGYPPDDVWSEESVDYSAYEKAVGERVARQQADYGIAFCASVLEYAVPRWTACTLR